MAEATRDLWLDGLQRAAAEPQGLPLLANKAVSGLFASTAAGKKAAQACLDQGWLQIVRTQRRGKTETAIAGLTDPGMTFLLNQTQPHKILAKFIEAVEARRGQLDEVLELVRRQQTALTELGHRVDQVLAIERPTDAAKNQTTTTILDALDNWQRGGALGDCPLPHLFKACTPPAPSIGQFHDAVRRLRDGGKIYLHPWTGPLYEIPEPALALLTGHEIAYYASPTH